MAESNETTVVLKVLHLEDNFAEIKKVRDALLKNPIDFEFSVRCATTPQDFRNELKTFEPDLVIADIRLTEDGEEGIALMQSLRKSQPEIVIIMCSSLDDVKTVRKSLLAGADDFLSKQCDHAELSLRVANAYKLAHLKRGQPARLSSSAEGGALSRNARFVPSVVGHTLQKISQHIPRLMDSAVTSVHVLGESGTGKEVVADLFAAHCAQRPFLKVNCGSISPTLLESELFGHARGAYTGAHADKKGYLEEAHGGWLFLDEIAMLSPSAQVALLRVLENQEITRVGETKARKVQVRIVSASNEPLADLVKQGRFRKDLWQRIREIEFYLPPLRDRAEEIPALVKHFCETMAAGPYSITQTALDVLCQASWADGNVRELRNCLRAMTTMHAGNLLTPLSIPDRVWLDSQEEKAGVRSGDAAEPKDSAAVKPRVTAEVQATEVFTEVAGLQLVLRGQPPTEQAPYPFERLSNLLFLQAVRLAAQNGKLSSMRQLARIYELSPSTVPRRLLSLVQEGYISEIELSELVVMSQT